MTSTICFIGGGNMASAIIGGLRQQDSARRILVVEPFAATRAKLLHDFNITAQEAPNAELSRAALVVWAVKPQSFQEAAAPVRAHTGNALHLSVAAGIRSDSISRSRREVFRLSVHFSRMNWPRCIAAVVRTICIAGHC